jgi:hypothetical protein
MAFANYPHPSLISEAFRKGPWRNIGGPNALPSLPLASLRSVRLPSRNSDASFRRETLTEVELVSGGLAVSVRGLSLLHDGPAVLILDEGTPACGPAHIARRLCARSSSQQDLGECHVGRGVRRPGLSL